MLQVAPWQLLSKVLPSVYNNGQGHCGPLIPIDPIDHPKTKDPGDVPQTIQAL